MLCSGSEFIWKPSPDGPEYQYKRLNTKLNREEMLFAGYLRK